MPYYYKRQLTCIHAPKLKHIFLYPVQKPGLCKNFFYSGPDPVERSTPKVLRFEKLLESYFFGPFISSNTIM